MRIDLVPLRSDALLMLARAGDVLTINGEAFDFTPLPEGASLPAEAIDSDWFAGPVERIDGRLHLTLTLPHGPRAPEATRFPAALEIEDDGPVPVQAWTEVEEEENNAED
ncbi:hypothetical protein [Pararhodobacter sp. SW119]|uniref:hypothetical protein n=1 Tax=Pararhodobacter sp. SW119 TaxID=2780075 RepID=UPI001ADED9C0|nr:hypothetical protein [Pararhodobacter sp. SW119]